MLLNNLLANVARPTVDSCLRNGQCTFMATGTNFQMQEVYRCVTCNLTGRQGVCSVCAQKCHKGHSLIPSGRLNFYCDCNSRGCSAQSVAPISASLQITVPGVSISANPQPYPQPQPQMFNPYPQPTVVRQEVHHHHVVVPPTMPYPVQMTSCPACTGKGGIGAFGPCHRGDVHWRRNCNLCNGSGSVQSGYRPCNMCQTKGATGAFGPCTQEDVHFRALCHVCNGKGYLYDTPSYPQPVYPQPTYPPQPVQPIHVHHHHPQPTHHHVTYTSHVSGPSVTCPVCTGKGGIGTFGPCAKGNMHWKRDCSFCSGSGNAMPGSRPCTMCSGKGGMGTFGPCEVGSIHFKSVCNGCHGKCHVY